MSTTHRYVTGRYARGVVIHTIGAVPTSHGPCLLLVDDDGQLNIEAAESDQTSVVLPGGHGYTAVEHDRTEWIDWGSGHRSRLYVDVTGPDGFHAQLLWDEVGYPFVFVQNGQASAVSVPGQEGQP